MKYIKHNYINHNILNLLVSSTLPTSMKQQVRGLTSPQRQNCDLDDKNIKV